MLTIHRDRHYTFRFADDRLIPLFHLEGIEAGRRVQGFNIHRAIVRKRETPELHHVHFYRT